MKTVGICEVRSIDEGWNQEILAIEARSPVVAGGMKMVFDHRPDAFLLPALRSQGVRCAGFFIRDALHGFAMLLRRDAFVDAALRPVLYFCNLHVDDAARGKGFLYRASDVLLAGSGHEASLGHAVVLRGNQAAARLMNRFHPRYPNMPHARIVGQWEARSILLTPYPRFATRHATRPARLEDIDPISDLLRKAHAGRLFGRAVDRETLLNDLARLPNFSIENFCVAEAGGAVVGVCCAWDMTPVKRNRVLEYGSRFRHVRRLHRLLAAPLSMPPLPAEGAPFRDVTITDYAVKDRDPAILRSLLTHIHREYRRKGYHLLHFGASANDPLVRAARSFPGRSLVSDVVVFSRSRSVIERIPDPAGPWIDMALL